MFTMQYDEKFIEQIAAKIADRATDMLVERLSSLNQLPHILTRTEAMEVPRCGPTKMAELMARPDFPVNEECGKKVPTTLLFKWIESNTRWVAENTAYYQKGASA